MQYAQHWTKYNNRFGTRVCLVSGVRLWTRARQYDNNHFWVAWWHNGYGVGLAIRRLWVRFPVGPLSSYLGQLSLSSLRGR